MTGRGITIIGLGPAGAEYLTREAWAHLEQCDEIWLRTKFHPAVAGLPEGVRVRSFDEIYDSGEDIATVLETIVQQVLELGKREQGVTYGVPGSPFVAEETVTKVMKAVEGSSLPIRLIDGVSFIEPVCSALGIDLHPQMVLADALHLAELEVPSFPPTLPAIISQLDSSFEASELKLTLMANYPQDHPVMLVHNAGTSDEIVEKLALYEIDQSVHLGMLSCLYVPALSQGASFEDFQQIIARLRRSDGCPWDREQTHLSLRPYLLEEAYEVLEALDQEDYAHLREELGDLLLQIGLHAQIATEDEDFLMSEVLQGISAKLIRRHPHVFRMWMLTRWTKCSPTGRGSRRMSARVTASPKRACWTASRSVCRRFRRRIRSNGGRNAWGLTGSPSTRSLPRCTRNWASCETPKPTKRDRLKPEMCSLRWSIWCVGWRLTPKSPCVRRTCASASALLTLKRKQQSKVKALNN